MIVICSRLWSPEGVNWLKIEGVNWKTSETGPFVNLGIGTFELELELILQTSLFHLSQGLCTPNLGRWWRRIRNPTHKVTWPLGHVTTQRRYISTFVRPMEPKLSRILVILWLLRQRFVQKEIGWSKYQLISILLCQKKLVLAENKHKNAN